MSSGINNSTESKQSLTALIAVRISVVYIVLTGWQLRRWWRCVKLHTRAIWSSHPVDLRTSSSSLSSSSVWHHCEDFACLMFWLCSIHTAYTAIAQSTEQVSIVLCCKDQLCTCDCAEQSNGYLWNSTLYIVLYCVPHRASHISICVCAICVHVFSVLHETVLCWVCFLACLGQGVWFVWQPIVLSIAEPYLWHWESYVV